MERSPLLWLHNKSHLRKWFGINFHWCLYNRQNRTWPLGYKKNSLVLKNIKLLAEKFHISTQSSNKPYVQVMLTFNLLYIFYWLMSNHAVLISWWHNIWYFFQLMMCFIQQVPWVPEVLFMHMGNLGHTRGIGQEKPSGRRVGFTIPDKLWSYVRTLHSGPITSQTSLVMAPDEDIVKKWIQMAGNGSCCSHGFAIMAFVLWKQSIQWTNDNNGCSFGIGWITHFVQLHTQTRK